MAETHHLIVEYPHTTTSLVSNMHFMALITKFFDGATLETSNKFFKIPCKLNPYQDEGKK